LPTEADMKSGIREAESFIPPKKLMTDIPLYAHERTAKTKETVNRMPTRDAIEKAKRERAEILYDAETAVPRYTYFEKDGTEKEICFTDARSVEAYLSLVDERDLLGAFFLPMGSFYSPAFLSLATSYYIQKPID
jgi:spore germination protein